MGINSTYTGKVTNTRLAELKMPSRKSKSKNRAGLLSWKVEKWYGDKIRKANSNTGNQKKPIKPTGV